MSLTLLSAAGFAPAFGGMMIIFLFVALAASIFWLWMLIDAIVNEPSGTDKILWVLVILFLHLLGALLYFFFRRGQRTNRIT